MAMLNHYILNGIPVYKKTRTTLIAYEYITQIFNKDSEYDDSLLRFNLSAETKIDDLLVKFAGDNNSASGLKVEEGQLFRSQVLECIQQALGDKVLSVESSGKILEKNKMNKRFGIIATKNPNEKTFANKRQELENRFSIKISKNNFPNYNKEELIDISKGLVKKIII